ncbi:hypothetical protein ACRALDRAFT_1061788 [Sodiomyces alcalophilus JCM 7366]|uniref:uncharacterized protein n=1 Tax=Sodiomyces alcalophilus JCM 7366 TaxID=591952 RepID=UPI0039B3E743
MLSEQERRNIALGQAYSALYAQYMGLRAAHDGIQPPMPMYDMSTTLVDAGLASTGGSVLEGHSDAFLFQNMPGYTG